MHIFDLLKLLGLSYEQRTEVAKDREDVIIDNFILHWFIHATHCLSARMSPLFMCKAEFSI